MWNEVLFVNSHPITFLKLTKHLLHMELVDRFFAYVQKNTQSDEDTNLTPSTPGQMAFAKDLANELKSIGLQDVTLSDYGYVMATLPANTDEPRPVVGFIAHMDTSPDMSGKNVSPQIVRNYQGGDIVLDPVAYVVLSPSDFPELNKYIGQDIITTNGKTLSLIHISEPTRRTPISYAV